MLAEHIFNCIHHQMNYIIKKLLGRLIKNELARERKAGYEQGCLAGWRNAEDHTIELIAIAKREGEKGARLELLAKMRTVEDKAYTDGLRDAGLILSSRS